MLKPVQTQAQRAPSRSMGAAKGFPLVRCGAGGRAGGRACVRACVSACVRGGRGGLGGEASGHLVAAAPVPAVAGNAGEARPPRRPDPGVAPLPVEYVHQALHLRKRPHGAFARGPSSCLTCKRSLPHNQQPLRD